MSWTIGYCLRERGVIGFAGSLSINERAMMRATFAAKRPRTETEGSISKVKEFGVFDVRKVLRSCHLSHSGTNTLNTMQRLRICEKVLRFVTPTITPECGHCLASYT